MTEHRWCPIGDSERIGTADCNINPLRVMRCSECMATTWDVASKEMTKDCPQDGGAWKERQFQAMLDDLGGNDMTEDS